MTVTWRSNVRAKTYLTISIVLAAKTTTHSQHSVVFKVILGSTRLIGSKLLKNDTIIPARSKVNLAKSQTTSSQEIQSDRLGYSARRAKACGMCRVSFKINRQIFRDRSVLQSASFATLSSFQVLYAVWTYFRTVWNVTWIQPIQSCCLTG